MRVIHKWLQCHSRVVSIDRRRSPAARTRTTSRTCSPRCRRTIRGRSSVCVCTRCPRPFPPRIPACESVLRRSPLRWHTPGVVLSSQPAATFLVRARCRCHVSRIAGVMLHGACVAVPRVARRVSRLRSPTLQPSRRCFAAGLRRIRRVRHSPLVEPNSGCVVPDCCVSMVCAPTCVPV